MKAALASFEDNLQRARDLVSLQIHLVGRTSSALDLDDILRAALVLGVSALDYLVHEVVRLGMLETQQAQRAPTPAFLNFPISLERTRTAVGGASSVQWLDDAIREAHSWQTFQRPDKIADAIRLVSNVKIWDVVGKQLGSDPKSMKATLSAIVDRRNKIAHEADLDPSFPGQRWPITDILVSDALDFLEKSARAIVAAL